MTTHLDQLLGDASSRAPADIADAMRWARDRILAHNTHSSVGFTTVDGDFNLGLDGSGQVGLFFRRAGSPFLDLLLVIVGSDGMVYLPGFVGIPEIGQIPEADLVGVVRRALAYLRSDVQDHCGR